MSVRLLNRRPSLGTRAVPRPQRCHFLLGLVLAVGIVASGACRPVTALGAGPAAEHHALGSNPFIGATWWSDPESTARHLALELAPSRRDEAALLSKIADHAAADWVGEWTPDLERWVVARIAKITARAPSAVPVFVIYRIPDRDCGLYSAGGMPTAEAYREWIAAFARGVRAHKTAIVLEPDAISESGCLPPDRQAGRLALLKFAVESLEANPDTWVYLDAGYGRNSLTELAPLLRAAGIEQADGFFLNVSNYQANDALLAYGEKLSALVHGKPFVIDTSRNGNGPPSVPDGNGPSDVSDRDVEAAWCNPDGRALGLPSTAATGNPLCHAFLWIKKPGESDGDCNGGPKAGDWFHQQALTLARNAPW